jgi:hypothetical protein
LLAHASVTPLVTRFSASASAICIAFICTFALWVVVREHELVTRMQPRREFDRSRVSPFGRPYGVARA